jgi:hypothetical protein
MLPVLPVLTRSLIADHDSWADPGMLVLLCCVGAEFLKKVNSIAFYEHRSY